MNRGLRPYRGHVPSAGRLRKPTAYGRWERRDISVEGKGY